MQNETCGHRCRRDDQLWRVRRRLSIAAERLTVDPHERLVGLLRAGDPELADQWVAEIIRNFADESMPIEVRRLGRTIKKWAAQITAWHRSHVSNGLPRELPTSSNPLPPLRRQTRLGTTQHDPTMKRGEPRIPCVGSS